ncbi:MAG: glycine cleavage system aminomethyltransferase GcvT [Lachnospiraceae bacterium]|nr:glycine cleavage system aminomethyltransferase GcvT [Lachnospiraceae bacterium]
MELKKTPLYEAHVRAGGKMVEFGGFLMPVQYGTGVIQEHMAVRTACGLFDVSHMGEVLVEGADAVRYLNYLLTNDYTVMEDGQARYSPMCNEKGGTVDDLIVYKVRDGHYFIVVNASNKDKDVSWMKAHVFGDVAVKDVSDEYGQIALQGPKAETILEKLTEKESIPEKNYTARFDRKVGGISCIVSRTGYTGSDGFELYTAAADTEKMWQLLLDAGAEEGLIPCGLGARDTLRLEACMPLYGHELTDAISPLTAGLGIFVKMEKEDFIGKKAMEEAGEPAMCRVGLKTIGRGIIREHQDVYADGVKIGQTTSGTHCPYVGYPAAMAIIDRAYRKTGTRLEVDVRGRRVEAEVVKMPFYKK